MPSPQSPSLAGTALDPTAVRGPHLDDAEIVRVAPGELRATLLALRDAGGAMLLDLGAVDYLGRTPRFDVVYHVLALAPHVATAREIGTPKRTRVLVALDAGETLPSIVDMWPNADWCEREIFDLFGIAFVGHPDLKRIQMPYAWEGHPLRKDYPLRGPAREATPRPPFALKSNVPAGAPPSGKVAVALQKQIARARAKEKDAT